MATKILFNAPLLTAMNGEQERVADVPISKKDVLHVADLARLALTEEEIELYTSQLQRILNYVEKLSELNTEGVEPTAYAEAKKTVFREDAVRPSIAQEEALMNAPEKERGCFKVPKIIE